MKCLILFLFLILFSFNVFGLDCSSFEGEKLNACQQFFENVSNQDSREEFAGALLNPNYLDPDYGFVKNWNSNISFSTAPEGVSYSDSRFIKDAWLKIVSVSPSVMEKGEVFVPSEGDVLSAYDYSIVIPSGTASGDCRTDYSLGHNLADLSVYSGDHFLGSGRLTPFLVNESSVFIADLNIEVEVIANHHKLFTYCCSWGRRGCSSYCTDCRFSNTERMYDSLDLRDSFSAELYDPNPEYDFRVTGKYYNSTSMILNFSNASSVKLSVGNSSYYKASYVYLLKSSYKPYDVLSYSAIPSTYSEIKGMYVLERNASSSFIVPDASNCSFELKTHFKEVVEFCNVSVKPVDLEVISDRLVYVDGDTMSLKISPDDSVLVEYANESYSGFGSLNLTASYPHNRIRVSIGDRSKDLVVSVQEKDKLGVLFGLAVFSGLNFAVYKFLFKFWKW